MQITPILVGNSSMLVLGKAVKRTSQKAIKTNGIPLPGQKTMTWKHFTAVLLAAIVLPFTVWSDDSVVDRLFLDLHQSDQAETRLIERKIRLIWMDSGSEEVNELLIQSIAAMRSNNYELALDYANRVIERKPEFAEGWNTRATLHYLMQEFDLSVADIVRTLELNSRHFGALNGLAMIYEREEEYAKALRVYLEVYALSPNRAGIKEAIRRLQKTLQDQSA